MASKDEATTPATTLATGEASGEAAPGAAPGFAAAGLERALGPQARRPWPGGVWPAPAKIGALALLSVAFLLAHYLTPATHAMMALHDLYERLLYLPIFLASFWFGWRGGLACAAAIALAYFPHVQHDWGGHFFSANLNRTLEAVMYFVVGGVTGFLIDCLRRANRHLAQRTEQLDAALQKLTAKTKEVFDAEEQLRRADRLAALGQLSAGLAHEIRGPLGSIQGAAEILGDANLDPAARAKFIGVLIDETKRLDRVVGNFLDYARQERAGGGQEAGSVALVMDRLGELLRARLNASHATLNVNIAPELPMARMSETFLQQVLLNLLLNAIQAMPRGGQIEVGAWPLPDGRHVVIRVRDSGPGIPAGIRQQIFNPFFTTKPAGAGLGLSIVHKIVTSHRGSIELEDGAGAGANENAGAGAAFRVCVPSA